MRSLKKFDNVKIFNILFIFPSLMIKIENPEISSQLEILSNAFQNVFERKNEDNIIITSNACTKLIKEGEHQIIYDCIKQVLQNHFKEFAPGWYYLHINHKSFLRELNLTIKTTNLITNKWACIFLDSSQLSKILSNSSYHLIPERKFPEAIPLSNEEDAIYVYANTFRDEKSIFVCGFFYFFIFF